jgi:hypothetical protein
MGLNDEYSRDAYNYEQAYDSDGSDEFDPFVHPEDWQDIYSDELLGAWENIQNYLYTNFLAFRRECSYPKFVDFVMDPSRYEQTFDPSYHSERIWKEIQDVPAISERVMPENFYTWINIYLHD